MRLAMVLALLLSGCPSAPAPVDAPGADVAPLLDGGSEDAAEPADVSAPIDGGLDAAPPDAPAPDDAPNDARTTPSCDPATPGLTDPLACPDRWLGCRLAPDGSAACDEVTGTMTAGDECTVATASACDRGLQCLRETVSGSLVCRDFCHLDDPDPDCAGSQTCEPVSGLLNENDAPIVLPPNVGVCD